MEYRVEEIARAAGVSVDTVRFYQTRGLLPAPERRGRTAIYSEAHLERLRTIRRLNRQGLTLEGVGRFLRDSEAGDGVKESRLGAVAEAEGESSFSRDELARRAGIPEFLLDSAEQAGLLEPLVLEGEPRYTESDLRVVEAGTLLLRSGLPLQKLLPLARDHASNIERVTGQAIELFDRYVLHDGERAGEHAGAEAIRDAFREILPAVTTLVALHFQRTLLRGARARLAGSAEEDDLASELAQAGRLRVSWS